MNQVSDGSTRVTVTVPKEHYEILRAEARSRKVSLAWVVREAIERYVHEAAPLFHQEPIR
jgi:predicted DNA-binding protein